MATLVGIGLLLLTLVAIFVFSRVAEAADRSSVSRP
jgi:hypothetical protein